MIALRESGGLAELGAINVRDAGGLSDIGEAYVRDSGGLQSIWSPSGAFEAVPSELDVFGGRSSADTVQVTTFATVVNVTGGVPPYTHSWARTDGGPGTWDILPDGVSTRFRTLVPSETEYSAMFADTVTDARGSTVTTADVIATVRNFGDLGGGFL